MKTFEDHDQDIINFWNPVFNPSYDDDKNLNDIIMINNSDEDNNEEDKTEENNNNTSKKDLSDLISENNSYNDSYDQKSIIIFSRCPL